MVYAFRVVCCFDCKFYQVDQVKKSTNKWVCKLCGQKQSLKQTFFQGSSRECRQQVQTLNKVKGERDISISGKALTDSHEISVSQSESNCTFDCDNFTREKNYEGVCSSSSKWEKFLVTPDPLINEENGVDEEQLQSWVPSWHASKRQGKRRGVEPTGRRRYKPYVRSKPCDSKAPLQKENKALLTNCPDYREDYRPPENLHAREAVVDCFKMDSDDEFCWPDEHLTSQCGFKPPLMRSQDIPSVGHRTSKWSHFLTSTDTDETGGND